MPANLTPQYMEAEKRFKQAQTVPEKIAALEEMMATIPRHKGTEKLQAELKKKMSSLRKEAEAGKKGGKRETFIVEREGARQLVLIGAPNSGKSQLLRAVTHATPDVADYPYTTRIPIPGMLIFENIRLQLVDLPPISPEYTESWVPQVIRNADASLWVVDLSDDDVLEKLEETRAFLADAHADLSGQKVLMVGNKKDAAGSADRAAIVGEVYGSLFPMTTISAGTASSEEIEQFKRVVYDFLKVVRVYTKVPGKKPDFSDPYVVPRGSTVLDVAEKVHRDFVEHLKYARIWGDGKVDGIMVPRDFVIGEGDVLELHV
jgi:ribosome-interacting GTPase 1